MDQKICKCCSEKKSVEDFYKQIQRGPKGQSWRYHDSYCKPCRIRYATERRKRIKAQCVEYLGGKCFDCGLKTDRVEVYDFHHPDPSKKDFALGQNAKSFESCKPELDKCELLCANCHRLRHGQ